MRYILLIVFIDEAKVADTRDELFFISVIDIERVKDAALFLHRSRCPFVFPSGLMDPSLIDNRDVTRNKHMLAIVSSFASAPVAGCAQLFRPILIYSE